MTILNKMMLGAASIAAMSLSVPAGAVTVILSGTPGTTGATGAYVSLNDTSAVTSSDLTATAAELQSFRGAPDDIYTGIGGQWIQYDFGGYRFFDGAGFDFNVYEVDNGAVEFGSVDILVSLNGADFFNVEASAGTAVNLAGDEPHGNASFRHGYDLGAAAIALGVSEFRYIRLQGTATGPISGSDDFDPDAVGLVNFRAPPVVAPPGVPEPASWAMMIGGLAVVGSMMRRRSVQLRFA